MKRQQAKNLALTHVSDKQHVINSIARIAKELGHAPSRSEFITRSGISSHFVLRRFRGWNDAVRAAGLDPNTSNVRVEDRALLEDWGKHVRRNRGPHPLYAHNRTRLGVVESKGDDFLSASTLVKGFFILRL